ncbi:MAG: 23S rRNA (uracil(1939)-C(5))-methyltransferase RlmD [Gammaproteobacteria bacterium]|uniref:23S rRNA (uracil(1939)-C(5))-methyltransferase RlmD n=1 Tax=Candidatus Thiopontia autotrophica TaxID=2841688 RepID=A0A8J6TQI0_9GAMM|nr:23S rRNA (uracil(1939)-C(5))-methyltransferase RlmD [Candidatus Thiopontia autotrophica]
MGRRRRKPLPQEPVQATIESLAHDGKGITHTDGKVVFIPGTLPGEEVRYRLTGRRRSFDSGTLLEVLTSSPDRVEPPCPHFYGCGGCSLQQMEPGAQINFKQQTLLDNFSRLGKVAPESVLSPLTGPSHGYRRKARLGVRYVPKKGGALVGFREKQSGYLTVMDSCSVLVPEVGERIGDLRELITSMDGCNKIAQIEVACDDSQSLLVFRNLEQLSEADLSRLDKFGKEHDLNIYLQPKGPDSVTPLNRDHEVELSYHLNSFDLDYSFLPTDFTQVNSAINQEMVPLAIEMLQLTDQDEVLDLFCGLGNFTLPIAKTAGHVVGVEGDEALVQRARENAERNNIENAEFFAVDLQDEETGGIWLNDRYNKVLLDPPRSGALEIVQKMGHIQPERIVYVSCNPATLARDADELVNNQGYRLVSAGVMDMFPHTAHVESIALFVRGD